LSGAKTETLGRSKLILIADDDSSIRGLLQTLFAGEGYRTQEAATGREVMPAIHKFRPDLLVMDVRMPGLSGMEVLEHMKAGGVDIPVLLMTAFTTSNVAIRAMQLGAYDYVTKPFDIDDLLLTVQRTLDHRDLAARVQALDETPRDPMDNIIGTSPVMLDVFKTIGRVARSDATILIHGESGTGKELVASALYLNSHRRSAPFVKVACASLTESLLESELFGHEQGSFTSASRTRKGRFELADKGTIFLDEIGEMSLNTQKKLLRVLQEREFERVGSSTPISVDTRVIAATNRNLQEQVSRGAFREDLYYRLNVISFTMPPLRDRMDDVPILVEHFLQKYRSDSPTAELPRIAEDALEALVGYDWPGNVRELENVVHRAVVLARGEVITSNHIQFSGIHAQPDDELDGDVAAQVRRGMTLKQIVADAERAAIESALSQAGGNRSRAAKALGIYRRLLYAKLREFGIDGADADSDLDGDREPAEVA
jgi:two-component system response regulator AtoC